MYDKFYQTEQFLFSERERAISSYPKFSKVTRGKSQSGISRKFKEQNSKVLAMKSSEYYLNNNRTPKQKLQI